MKNIHVIATDKPSRLYYNTKGKCYAFSNKILSQGGWVENQNIYITSDEEIKEGDWYWLEKIGKRGSESGAYKSAGLKASKLNTLASNCKKVILTTDQDLITDGVQAIDDEFLEWFVKNPSCEEVAVEEEDYSQKCKECGETVKRGCSCKKGCFMKAGNFIPTDENIKYKIIIPKEEPTFVDKLKEYFENTSEEKIQKDWDETCEKTKGINSPTVEEFLEAQKQHLINMMQDDEKSGLYDESLEEAAKNYYENNKFKSDYLHCPYSFKDGAKWNQERSYSEEEVLELLNDYDKHIQENFDMSKTILSPKQWFEQFKKK